MQPRSIRSYAFLVRLWEEGTQGSWRASAQHVQSGKTMRFANTTKLFAFLQAQMVNTPEWELEGIDCTEQASHNQDYHLQADDKVAG